LVVEAVVLDIQLVVLAEPMLAEALILQSLILLFQHQQQ
jgi:hypothetical protein